MARSRRIYSGETDLPNRKRTVYASPNLLIKFEMDRAGIRKIAMGKELAKAVREVVVYRALPYALSISPTGSGNYREHFRVQRTTTVIASMRRVAAKLTNTSDHAAAVEFVNKRGHGLGRRVLGKTLDHLNHASIVEHQARSAAAKARFNASQKRDAHGRFALRGAIIEAAKATAKKTATKNTQRGRKRKVEQINVEQQLRTTRQWMDVRANFADDTGGGYDLSPLRFEQHPNKKRKKDGG